MIDWNNKRLQTYTNLVSSLVTMTIGLGVNFFLSPYIVKHLGVEANGFASLANNFIMYATLITITLNSMAGRFIALAYHQNNLERANKYYTSTIVGNIVIVACLILPAIYLTLNLENIISIEKDVTDVKIVFVLSFLNFFIGQLFSVFGVATFITNKLYIGNIITVFRTIINASLLVLTFSLFAPKIYFISAIAFCLSIINIVIIFKIKLKLTKDLQFHYKNFRWVYIKNLLGSGIWNTVNQAGNILMTGLDLLLANLFINPVQMGILAIAKAAPTHIIGLGHTVNNNFVPSLLELHAKGDSAGLLRELRSAMKISSVLMSIPIMTFCVFGQCFYQLWMPAVDSQQLIILSMLTCLAFIPAAGTQVLYNVFTITNKLRFNSIAFLINGVLNVLIVYLLLNYTQLGIYAVAGVSSITSIIRNLLLILPYTASLLKMKWYVFYADVCLSLICASVCGGIAALMLWCINPSNWGTLIIAVALTCILSFLAQIFILLNKTDRNKILRKINKNLQHT